jgi:hypothetical protein
VYKSDFDRNGIFYYLGTNMGNESTYIVWLWLDSPISSFISSLHRLFRSFPYSFILLSFFLSFSFFFSFYSFFLFIRFFSFFFANFKDIFWCYSHLLIH